MPKLTISLSESEKAFVDAHVRSRGLESAGEYISLVQMEQMKKHRDKIEALLLEGVRGPMTPMTKQDWKDIEREGLSVLAEERKNASKSPKKPGRSKRSA